MNKLQEEYFFNQIKINKGSDTEVPKDSVVAFAHECGIEVKKSVAKAKIVDMIIENGFAEKMYNEFSGLFYIPVWEVGKVFNLTSQQINLLTEIEIIKEKPILVDYRGRGGRFKAAAYPLKILEYDTAYFKSEYDKAFVEGIFRMRIETKTEEEVESIISILSKVLEVKKAPVSYEHRNENGYYTYLTVRPIQK